MNPIPYVIRIINGIWKSWFSPYTQQKYFLWDTDDCWDDTACSQLQAQLNYLKGTGQLSPQAINWYQTNGYLDSTGCFKISPRFIGILSGRKDQGYDGYLFCQLVAGEGYEYGFLPLSDLDYSDFQASQWINQAEFVADYFNPSAITPAMKAKARQALSWVNIQYQRIGKIGEKVDWQVLVAAQCQAPLMLGIPIPTPPESWNTVNVPMTTNTGDSHFVAVENFNDDKSISIHDNYNPPDKILPPGYPIEEVVQMVVTAKTQAAPVLVIQPWYNVIWQAVLNYFSLN